MEIPFYIAASFPRQGEAFDLAAHLTDEIGELRCISEWIEDIAGYNSLDQMEWKSARDQSNIDSAFILIEMTGDSLTHGGRHAELGFALGRNKPVVIFGPREHVLHYGVPQVDTVEELVSCIRRIIVSHRWHS